MNDLYQRLGFKRISPRIITRDMIVGVLRRPEIPSNVRAAAEGILLNENRRVRYARTVEYLRAVGEVRSHLGLQQTESWPSGRYSDFEYPVQESVPKRKPVSRFGLSLALIVFCVCAALLTRVIVNHEFGYERSRAPSAAPDRHVGGTINKSREVQSGSVAAATDLHTGTVSPKSL